MLKLLIDTCVWLDMAKDPEQQKTLRVMEQLIEMKEISLLLPKTVFEEFNRNKERIVRTNGQSFSDAIKRAKKIVDILGSNDTKGIVLNHLDDVSHKIPGLADSAFYAVQEIEKVFKLSTIIETTEQLKLKASQRAIDKLAPFHKNKNSINDAIIIETYAECLNEKKNRNIQYAFVTHNKDDFSKPNGHEKEPHPDLALYFTNPRSSYYIKLAEALQKINPELISDLMIEQEGWEEEPRNLSEILAALEELFDKIWYNRHHNLLYKIKTGEYKIIKVGTPGVYKTDEILESVYKAARKAAKSVERKYGLENLGPWDDFEWGMLNGKMSALRWALGDEWDFLDT